MPELLIKLPLSELSLRPLLPQPRTLGPGDPTVRAHL